MSKVKVYLKVKGQVCQNIIIQVKGHFLGRGHPKVKGYLKIKGQFKDWLSNGHIVKFTALEMTPISHKSRFFHRLLHIFSKSIPQKFPQKAQPRKHNSKRKKY